jgi:hypothetical protein
MSRWRVLQLAALILSLVPGAANAGSDPRHDVATGIFTGRSANGELHVRLDAHFSPKQQLRDTARGRGHVDFERTTAAGTVRGKGELVCGFVKGHEADLLYRLRRPVPTEVGEATLVSVVVVDNGEPGREAPDVVFFGVFSAEPEPEPGTCFFTGDRYTGTNGNLTVHDGQPRR